MNETVRKALVTIRSLPFLPAVMTGLKKATVSISFMFFGPAFEVVSEKAPELKKEIEDWDDGRRFSIGVLPDGPAITLEKKGPLIRYVGRGYHSPVITMNFKNLDTALPVFLGLKGTYQAFAENSIIIHGNLNHTMEINRVVGIVTGYLFPGIILPKVLKRPPKMTLSRCVTKAKVYGGIVPAVVRHVLGHARPA